MSDDQIIIIIQCGNNLHYMSEHGTVSPEAVLFPHLMHNL